MTLIMQINGEHYCAIINTHYYAETEKGQRLPT